MRRPFFTFPSSTSFPPNISRRIACLLPAMRLSYYPAYCPVYSSAYYLLTALLTQPPPIERALRPPSLGAARPPEGPARHEGVDPPCSPTAIPAKGLLGVGKARKNLPTYLSYLIPLIIILLIIFLLLKILLFFTPISKFSSTSPPPKKSPNSKFSNFHFSN